MSNFLNWCLIYHSANTFFFKKKGSLFVIFKKDIFYFT